MNKICPNCGSEKTALLSVIFEGQVGYSQSNISVMGFDADRIVIGGGDIIKTSITALGKRFAPPQEPIIKPVNFIFKITIIIGFMFLIFGYVVSLQAAASYRSNEIIFLYSIGGILIFGGIGLILYFKLENERRFKDSLKIYLPKLEKWKRGWGCLQCGTSYFPK